MNYRTLCEFARNGFLDLELCHAINQCEVFDLDRAYNLRLEGALANELAALCSGVHPLPFPAISLEEETKGNIAVIWGLEPGNIEKPAAFRFLVGAPMDPKYLQALSQGPLGKLGAVMFQTLLGTEPTMVAWGEITTHYAVNPDAPATVHALGAVFATLEPAPRFFGRWTEASNSMFPTLVDNCNLFGTRAVRALVHLALANLDGWWIVEENVRQNQVAKPLPVQPARPILRITRWTTGESSFARERVPVIINPKGSEGEERYYRIWPTSQIQEVLGLDGSHLQTTIGQGTSNKVTVRLSGRFAREQFRLNEGSLSSTWIGADEKAIGQSRYRVRHDLKQSGR